MFRQNSFPSVQTISHVCLSFLHKVFTSVSEQSGDMMIAWFWIFFICFFVFWSDCQSHAFWWSGQTLLVLSVCFWPLCHLASCLTSSFLGLFVAHIWVLCFLWFPVFSFMWQHIFGFLCVFSRFTCFPWGGKFSCYLTNSLSLSLSDTPSCPRWFWLHVQCVSHM